MHKCKRFKRRCIIFKLFTDVYVLNVFLLRLIVTHLHLFDVGHQKKLMLAVKRLAEMQRGTDGRGSLRKKPPPITQQQEVMSMDSPPPDGEITGGVSG